MAGSIKLDLIQTQKENPKLRNQISPGISMDKHIQAFLNKLSLASILIATLTLLSLFLHTPETCITTLNPKPHQKFPKSTCESSHRGLTSVEKRNHHLWSSKTWLNTVSSFSTLFLNLQSLSFLSNHSKALVLSAGPGHAVMALNQLGVVDVTGVELVDLPPLVSRADPHNLPFFDNVFDFCFSAYLDQALFPARYVGEMERTVRVGGVCVVAVEECGDEGVKEVARLFRKSKFVGAKNVILVGSKMTRIIMRVTSS